MLPGAARHETPGTEGEGAGADLDTVAAVLGEVVQALERARVAYALIGGLASSVLGRPRCSNDVDVLVAPAGAEPAITALARAGFEIDRINPHWLYKAFKRDVLVDVLFKASGDLYLDDEMVRRSTVRTFRGTRARVLPPEDLIVMKAIAFDEETPRHWYDALGMLRSPELDWDYLATRARCRPHRVLSLLHFAASIDVPVPRRILRRLARPVLHA